MKKLSFIVGMVFFSALALWMFTPDPSFAQRGSTSVRASAHVPGIVIGKPIYSEANVELGTVENIVLNDSGCAEFLVMSGQFSGASGRLFPLPFSVVARTGPDAIFVNVDQDVLVNAPIIEANRLQVLFTPQFRTQVQTFFQKRAEVTAPGTTHAPGTVAPGTSQAPGALRSEEKTKFQGDIKARERGSEKHVTEGARLPEEKARGKTRLESERKHTPSEMGKQGAVESSKQREMDVKAKQQAESKAGGTAGTMERGQTQMKERGQAQMMERGKLQEERSMQKSAPGHAGVQAPSGQTEERVK